MPTIRQVADHALDASSPAASFKQLYRTRPARLQKSTCHFIWGASDPALAFLDRTLLPVAGRDQAFPALQRESLWSSMEAKHTRDHDVSGCERLRTGVRAFGLCHWAAATHTNWLSYGYTC